MKNVKRLLSLSCCIAVIAAVTAIPMSAKAASARDIFADKIGNSTTNPTTTGRDQFADKIGNSTNNQSSRTSMSGTVNLVRTNYPSSVTLGSAMLSSSSSIRLRIPNNSKKDLVQGSITLIPMSGGTSKTYNFTNNFNEDWNISLSGISAGMYRAVLKPSVYGTSNKATLSYTIG